MPPLKPGGHIAGVCNWPGRICRRTFARVSDLEGALLFAGIPLAVVALVFAVVFLTNEKPSREPIAKPVLDKTDDDTNGSAASH